MMQVRSQLSLLLGTLLLLLIAIPLVHKPHQISLNINGSSSLTIPADRAQLSIHISIQGSKQHKVANDVRQKTAEVLNLLRPLTLPATRAMMDSKASTTELFPPIATLSVDTFSSNSWPQSGLLGETTTYSATTKVTAEFRSVSPLNQQPNTTIHSGAGFHHLSLVLPVLAKTPNTKVNMLKWYLSPERLVSLQSEARQNAMAEAITKITDYTAPMQMRYPTVRCLHFREERYQRPCPRIQYDTRNRFPDIDRLVLMDAHDELDGPSFRRAGYGYDIEQQATEALGMEPQSIEISSHIEGEWVVIEQGNVRRLWESLV